MSTETGFFPAELGIVNQQHMERGTIQSIGEDVYIKGNLLKGKIEAINSRRGDYKNQKLAITQERARILLLVASIDQITTLANADQAQEVKTNVLRKFGDNFFDSEWLNQF